MVTVLQVGLGVETAEVFDTAGAASAVTNKSAVVHE